MNMQLFCWTELIWAKKSFEISTSYFIVSIYLYNENINVIFWDFNC